MHSSGLVPAVPVAPVSRTVPAEAIATASRPPTVTTVKTVTTVTTVTTCYPYRNFSYCAGYYVWTNIRTCYVPGREKIEEERGR